ncbi:MAG: radical SAM protein [Candidatus Aenigmarchaeota archaeon]|nr:radical SAM protein [Candidatus Aenigmarchaeota archaeon]
MKILFVYKGAENLGIESLSSYIKEKGDHETYLFFDKATFSGHMYLHSKLLDSFFKRGKEGDLIKEIERINPDVICFSVFSGLVKWALNMSRLIKKRFNIPIVFGGVHITVCPDEILNNENVDFVVLGEGEEALLQLLSNLENPKKYEKIKNLGFKKNGKMIINPVDNLRENLDELPFPDKELFYKHSPVMKKDYMIMTGRGCPFSCSYCCNNFYNEFYRNKGKILRRHSVKYVIEQLLHAKKFGYKTVLFQDDIFVYDIKWLREFLNEYKKKINKPFKCMAHPQHITEEIAMLLKDAGCYTVKIGIQTGSEELRSRILQRHESNKQIIEGVRILKKYKLNTRVDHILGIPYESENDLVQSAMLYNYIRPKIICCYWLTYFPKTKIIDYALEAGVLDEQDVERIKSGDEGFIYTDGSKPEKHSKISKKIEILFYLVPLLPKSFISKIIEKRYYKYIVNVPFLKVFLHMLNAIRFRDIRVYYYLRYLIKG